MYHIPVDQISMVKWFNKKYVKKWSHQYTYGKAFGPVRMWFIDRWFKKRIKAYERKYHN